MTMALNSFRDAPGLAGLRAFHRESPFRSEADAALDGFRAFRKELERKVHQNDLTVKSARAQAASAAARLREDLLAQCEGFSTAPRVFLERVVEAGSARRKAREALSIEAL